MKRADLQQAMELEAALMRLDGWPAGEAHLTVKTAAGDEVVTLYADHFAAFVEWRRQGIRGELRRLGVDDGDGEASQQDHNEAATTRAPGVIAPAHAAPSQARRPVVTATTPTREEAYDEAREYYLADHLAMLAKGLIQRADFEHVASQRADRIRERAEEMLRRPAPAQCEDCAEPATTTIDGRGLCDQHAQQRPRLSRPAFLGGEAA